MKLQLETSSGAALVALGVFIGIVGTTVVRPRLPLGSLSLTSGTESGDQAAASPTPEPSVPFSTLVFSDEFDGAKLDSSKWLDSYPGGVRTHSNNEKQYYAPDGYYLRDGKLVFKALRRKMGGMPYTSGMVASYGKFSQTFGRFEIRAKFPKGKGLWPAFWLLPESRAWPPEIDILEILGHDPKTIYFNNHWRTEEGVKQNAQGLLQGTDFSADFHTITLDWKPDVLIWSVDGVERFRSTERVPQEPMYVIANLAVGGDWPGFPDATTPFPARMEIDYIRVWKL